jgi:hypothetical protein
MDKELILPITPFRREEPYTRGGKQSVIVYGINDNGFGFMYIEDVELDPAYDLTVRWVPVKMDIEFDNYGVSRPVSTYWKKTLVNNGKYVPSANEETIHMVTNWPDMITFTAGFGIKILPSVVNGKIRCIDGFDNQPVFDMYGNRLPDSDIDTTQPPTFGYKQRTPDYRTVVEPEGQVTEETVVEPEGQATGQ